MLPAVSQRVTMSGLVFQFLDQSLACLSNMIDMLAGAIGLARLALDPLPILNSLGSIRIDDHVLADGFTNGSFNLLSRGVTQMPQTGMTT